MGTEEDVVDAVALVGLGGPCQLLYRHQRIVRGEGEAGVGAHIGMHCTVGVRVACVVEEQRNSPRYDKPVVVEEVFRVAGPVKM